MSGVPPTTPTPASLVAHSVATMATAEATTPATAVAATAALPLDPAIAAVDNTLATYPIKAVVAKGTLLGRPQGAAKRRSRPPNPTG